MKNEQISILYFIYIKHPGFSKNTFTLRGCHHDPCPNKGLLYNCHLINDYEKLCLDYGHYFCFLFHKEIKNQTHILK